MGRASSGSRRLLPPSAAERGRPGAAGGLGKAGRWWKSSSHRQPRRAAAVPWCRGRLAQALLPAKGAAVRGSQPRLLVGCSRLLGGPGCCCYVWLRWRTVWCYAPLLPALCPAPSAHQPCGSISPLNPSPPWQMEPEGAMHPPLASPLLKPGSAISLEGVRAPVWGV